MSRIRRDDDEGGFALVFVLLVITVVMIGVGSALVVLTPNIAGAKRSQDSAAALLAAQSGIDDAVAYLTNVPSCRSETRICPQALGASSAALAGTKYQRPALSPTQTFSWTTGASATSDGYVRVTSTGTAGGTKRALIADLSLQPSILAYGYYTDYESQAPAFFDRYYTARSVYLANSTTYGQVNSNYRGSSTAPQTATWNGAANSSSTGYPDSVCGQHWYYESAASPGRAQKGSTWYESGKVNGASTLHGSSCDLVFTSGMTEDGPTFSRDAFYISNGSGSGPVFKQPVYTLWGYPGHDNPAPSAQPWRQATGNETLASSPYRPAVARSDITLPASVGTDGVSEDSCVYYGPTRVKLNGDGTATVTSPETTTKNPDSDPRCYPSGALTASGIVGFKLNYTTAGSGTVYVKNVSKPKTGWPQSSLKSTTTPSSSNEIFYLPVTGSTAPDASASVAPSAGCTSTVKYSAAVSAACAWTNVATTTDATATTGWSAYSNTATCNNTIAATNRQLFECEYGQKTGQNTTPPSNQYGAFRSSIQSYLAGGTCVSGAISDQVACVSSGIDSVIAVANTSGHAYNYGTPASGDHQYYAVTTAGTASTGTARAVGTSPASPTAGDPLFTFTGTAAQEKPTTTPITTTVYRQVYAGGKWGTGTPQFTFTITDTDWTITQQAGGASYFPNPGDVTTYDTGATSAGAAAGSSGVAQPGDLYVEGVNSGALSLIADNNVEITDDITKVGADTSAVNPLSLTAAGDVRNYHPVSCVDQTASDVNNTSAGWCPNDILGLNSSSLVNSDGSFTAQHPAAQYTNITGTGDRTVDAAIFTLTGSLRTDNYDRGVWVGNLNVYGGIYQSHRGANGVQYSNTSTPARSGTSLQYSYVDLQRAHLPYAPAATNSQNPRVWNVVSISAANPS